MQKVTIRELRNHGGEVVNRVQAGESLLITRAGQPVAELRPVRRPGLSGKQLLKRWRHLQTVDGKALRRELDSILDSSL